MKSHLEAHSRKISIWIPPELLPAYNRRGEQWILEQLTKAAAADINVTVNRYIHGPDWKEESDETKLG